MKPPVLKTGNRKVRGFESHSLRHSRVDELVARLDDLFPAHVRPQHLGNDHAAVGLLIVLQYGDQCAPGGESGAGRDGRSLVNTIKRDYADLADHSSAAALLAQLPIWFDDYNHEAPHSALGMKTPAEYWREKSLLYPLNLSHESGDTATTDRVGSVALGLLGR